MATRTVITSASAPPVTGKQALDNIAGHINVLLNAIALVPTSISNSGNDYTITIDPPLLADVSNGMAFWVTPNVANTGGARLRVGTNPYYDLVKANGGAFASGELQPTSTYGIVFVGGEFRAVTVPAQEAGALLNSQTFTASGTWTKPSNLSPNAIVIIHLWGAGGGAGTAAGGGGGACIVAQKRLSELGVTESVTIGSGGSGGTTGSVGGNSSFGSHFTAFGGGGGGGGVGSGGRLGGGGGGGGARSAGATGSGGTGGNGGGGGGGGNDGTPGGASTTNFGIGRYGGGGGGSNADANNSTGGTGGGALFGGGGGGGAGVLGTGSDGGSGGDSTWGGGGGAGATNDVAAAAGVSLFGGNGGTAAIGAPVAGSAPGGGGGANGGSGSSGAAGARGECRVYIIA